MTPQEANRPQPGDDIIELTDIIEKGTVPAAADAVDFDKELEDLFADSDIEAAISNLSLPDEAPSPAKAAVQEPADTGLDSDIDAFLDALDGPGHAAPENVAPKLAQPTPTPGGRPVNPDEQLQMPDMSDMDSLLEQLDAPAATKSAGNIEDLDAGDLDALLDDILGGAPASPKAATMTPPPATEAEPAPMSLDDLDALLDAPVAPAAPAAPEPAAERAPGTATMSLDDIDALLDTPVAPAAPAAPEPAAGRAPGTATMSLDDIDALLDAPVAPAAPAAPEPAAEPTPGAAAMSLDDIDALLDAAPMPPAPEEAMPAHDTAAEETVIAAMPPVQEEPVAAPAAETMAVAAAATAMAPQGPVISPASGPMSAPVMDANALEGLLSRLQALEDEVAGLRATVVHGNEVTAGLEERLAALDAESAVAASPEPAPAAESAPPAEPLMPDADALGRILSEMLAEGHPAMEWLVEQVRAVVMNGMSDHIASAVERAVEQTTAPMRDALSGVDATAEGMVELDNRLSSLEATRITADDIAKLESALREALRDDTDKAAAAAAARVIRQEIAALAEIL